MSHTLIISEKPSAAEKIAAAIGKSSRKKAGTVSYYEVFDKGEKIIVAPAVGHLFTLRAKNKGEHPAFDLEWHPTYETKASAFSKPYFVTLQKLAKDAKEVIVACDYDIEGEVIGLNIVKFICHKKDAKRMKFSTLTAQDLKEAYANMSPTLDWGQADAGVTRHHLDWLWGVNLSRAVTDALTTTTKHYQQLSIGRVQGPTLSVLAERELEIQKFKPEPYWNVTALLSIGGKKFEAIHEKDKFWKKPEAQKIFSKIKNKKADVINISKTSQKVNPPFPFDLTSLQIEAYRVFRITPKQTLQVAQQLYTDALISYPRTSSQKLPPQLNYKKLLSDLTKQKDYSELAFEILNSKLTPNEGQKTDPAHPAIYPTGEIPRSLSSYQKKIYDLIVKRFLSVFADAGLRETTKVTFDISGEKFHVSGTRTLEKGWQKFYEPYVRREEIEFPKIEKGDKFDQKSNLAEKATEAPKRYTQASIIKQLEKENLGTKATRAGIIDTLYQRGYVANQSINVTKLGLEVVKVFDKYAPDILDKKMTRKFESDMEKIRMHKLKSDVVLENAYKTLLKISGNIEKHKSNIGNELGDALHEMRITANFLMKCNKCNIGSVRIIHSKRTGKQFAACDGYPKCKNTYPLPQHGAVVKTDKNCEQCKFPILKIAAKRHYQMCLNHKCPSKKDWGKPKEAKVAIKKD